MERRGKTMSIILFLLYVVLSSSGLILFKLGSGITDFSINLFNININLSFKTLIGIFCYGFSFLLWLYIVSKNDLTIVMPLSVALVNTLVVVGSCIFLKEQVTLMQEIGIFIVIFGVVIMKWGN